MRKRRGEQGGGKARGGVGPMVEVADCDACESLRACRSCVILTTKTRRRLTTICLVINPNARPTRFQRSSRFAVNPNLKVGKRHLCIAAALPLTDRGQQIFMVRNLRSLDLVLTVTGRFGTRVKCHLSEDLPSKRTNQNEKQLF